MKKLFLLMTLLIVLVGCSNTSTKDTSGNTKTNLLGKTFVLDTNENVTIEFTEDKVVGYTGINYYNGTYDLTEHTSAIKFGPIVKTLKASFGEAMAIERDYLATLQGVTSISVHGEKLTLSGGKGTLKFHAKPLTIEEKLDGKSYKYDTSIEGSVVRLSFKDGKILGNASVNNFSGDFKVKDGVLVVEKLATSRKIGPTQLMEQENKVLNLLTGTPSVKLDKDYLLLTSPTGEKFKFNNL